jgi:hypothetical protein
MLTFFTYKGEKAYTDSKFGYLSNYSSYANPYINSIMSPYGFFYPRWGVPTPDPTNHARFIHQTIALNNQLNRQAQIRVDAMEPRQNIWDEASLEDQLSRLIISATNDTSESTPEPAEEYPAEKKRQSIFSSSKGDKGKSSKPSKLASFKKSLGIKSTEEKAVLKMQGLLDDYAGLRGEILHEENGRWPDDQWRHLVQMYQEKVGMSKKIADLRVRQPLQYLHLIRAGYFEPIPVAWANQASNPLKFSIEAAAGWRGITPAWRGYEDTAEERLYWVLNHREGSVGMRMKPDFISEMNMARDRMATAVEPPPQYYSPNDTCHIQHTSEGYSKQVMPPPFQAYDRPEMPTDDTMILLDVSGSMDFDPVRPNYQKYLITGYSRSTQPKNKG